jgi:glycosyltransferase involved in cell wall biosynthesis
MRVGIIPDEFGMLSVKSVFQDIEDTLAQRHEIVRRSPEYFSASSARQQAMCEEFLRKSDVTIGRIDDGILQVREQLDRRPPLIGFLMGEMSRGAGDMAKWAPYLKSTDVLIGNCTGDVEITRKFLTNAQIKKLPFAFDDVTFRPIDEQRRKEVRAEMRFKETDKILLYAGRLSLEKNVHTLLRIFSVLQDLVPDLHLVIVGEPHAVQFQAMGVYPLSAAATLMKLMDKLRIKNEQVHFIGSKSASQLRELYAMADLLVNLTLNHDENFGLAQVEALACGTPVIGTSWGGLKDTIRHGETGYQISTVVTDSGVKVNWWEAINYIVSLLEDEAMLARFRENGRAYALEIFSRAQYAERLEAIVSDCEKLSHGPSEPVQVTDFARDYWLECQPREFAPPSFQRGEKSFAMYKELITPYAGLTENTIANNEPSKPDQILVLATAVRREGKLIKPDDPIFPLEFAIPEANQAAGEAILEVLRKQPVISLETLQQALPMPVQSCLQSTLKWMLEKGIVLRTKIMDAYLEPDMIGEQMAQPAFAIQPVDFATDVIVIRQTGAAHSYAAT